MKMIRLEHIDIVCEDLAESVAFYRKMGLAPEGTIDDGTTVFMFNGDSDSPVRVELHQQVDDQKTGVVSRRDELTQRVCPTNSNAVATDARTVRLVANQRTLTSVRMPYESSATSYQHLLFGGRCRLHRRYPRPRILFRLWLNAKRSTG